MADDDAPTVAIDPETVVSRGRPAEVAESSQLPEASAPSSSTGADVLPAGPSYAVT